MSHDPLTTGLFGYPARRLKPCPASPVQRRAHRRCAVLPSPASFGPRRASARCARACTHRERPCTSPQPPSFGPLRVPCATPAACRPLEARPQPPGERAVPRPTGQDASQRRTDSSTTTPSHIQAGVTTKRRGSAPARTLTPLPSTGRYLGTCEDTLLGREGGIGRRGEDLRVIMHSSVNIYYFLSGTP